MIDGFRKRLRAGELLYGTFLNLPSAPVAEILAGAGFDWLFIDTEHGAIGASALMPILQTVDRDIACIVRVPALGVGPIKRVLDLGAAGVIVPQVETAGDAAEAVRLSRYAPEGDRGFGLARAHGYGFKVSEYLARANDEVCVIVQVEHARAVENIEAIAAVPGLDAVFIGPYDLSASLGHPGEVEHPAVVAALDRVATVCRSAGMPLGYFGVDADAVARYVRSGYTLICAGVDCLFLGNGARRLAQKLRAIEGESQQ
jgi:2-keto-3-deoxy-L-rhamnonate aldolase RhmA